MKNQIILGNCIEELKKLKPNSVDAIITDPPYGLEFMGKEWDSFKGYTDPIQEAKQKRVRYYKENGDPVYWKLPTYIPTKFKFIGKNQQRKNELMENFFFVWAKECPRVLKPGGYLLSFGGTRTYHRMVCGIEDAGFEIRDTIMWIYASGFPKSLNVEKQLAKIYKSGNTSIEHGEQNTKHNLRPMSEEDISKTVNTENKQREILQSELQKQSSHETMQGQESKERTLGKEESSMEGRSNLFQNKGQLQRCEICKMSKEVSCYVKKGWLYYGTQINNGEEIKETSNENRSSASHRPQSNEQQDKESYAICEQCRTQVLRTFEGIGTALKPACEPIVVARKPLSEKNVALNVLKHGTGGINIDACRIEGEERDARENNISWGISRVGEENDIRGNKAIGKTKQGRFPANIILDEEAGKMLDEQSGFISQSGRLNRINNKVKANPFKGFSGDEKTNWTYSGQEHFDKGGASRFFYCAKASKSERNFGLDSLEDKRKSGSMDANVDNVMQLGGASLKGNPKQIQLKKNNHPTVKPIKLMEYLIKLVTRKGAIVLDPFIGSGTTAIACLKLNRKYIGIEKEEEYIKIANARIKPYLEQTKL